MNIYIPYFYIIQDIRNGMYYAGAKWSRDANPNKFMMDNGYQTSSSIVSVIIEDFGISTFITRKLKPFKTAKEAVDYETKFLKKNYKRINERRRETIEENWNEEFRLNLKIKKQEAWKVSSKLKDHKEKTRARRLREEENRTEEEKQKISDIMKNAYWGRPDSKIREHREAHSIATKNLTKIIQN